ncbi:urease accessory UreF family protein [Pseudonocardia sp. GCM10023141]|uniref:urease accessory UreF family protein n=1 Tax=Pseudonocardia sp. GCM10023141 TaxID=3252653 RepID=UPI00360B1690
MISSGLLLLADSRLPSGGHGHSGGVEALVDRGLLRTEADLALFLDGRLRAGAEVPAAAAAAACALAGLQESHFAATTLQESGFPATGCPGTPWARWDAALSARMPSAALRAASWAQGSALLRTVALAWPGPAVDALRALPHVHHPLVLGVAAAGAAASPAEAAALALHHLVGGACTAVVRLLGLDPIAVAAVAAAAGRTAEPVARHATAAALLAVTADDPALLPTAGSPLHDVLAQLHRSSEATLFAS